MIYEISIIIISVQVRIVRVTLIWIILFCVLQNGIFSHT